MRCRAFTGDKIQLNRFQVDPDDTIRVWDSVAGHFTLHHSLSPGQQRKVIGLANKGFREAGGS